MGPTRNALASPASLPRAGSVIAWALALIAGLTVVRLTLYALAAQPWGGFEAGMCQWDCEWYVHTIEQGYDPEPRLRPDEDLTNWAFFPLFPLLAWMLRLVTKLPAFWAGTLVSAACFVGFAVVALRYRALTRGPQSRGDDLTWLTMLTVYPFGFYFFVPYTEALFLLLTVLLLLAIRTRRAAEAGWATALLTAARPTGILAVPCLVVERMWHARLAFRPGVSWSGRLRVLADCAFPLALAPLGLALYMVYLYWLTGDALAFSHVQAAWDREFFDPLRRFYWALAKNDWLNMFDPAGPQSESYSAFFVVVAGVACLWLLWQRLPVECWLLGAPVLLALTTSIDSIPRYVTGNPVFLLVLGDLMDRVRPLAIRIALAAAAVLLQAYLLRAWFNNSGLLM